MRKIQLTLIILALSVFINSVHAQTEKLKGPMYAVPFYSYVMCKAQKDINEVSNELIKLKNYNNISRHNAMKSAKQDLSKETSYLSEESIAINKEEIRKNLQVKLEYLDKKDKVLSSKIVEKIAIVRGIISSSKKLLKDSYKKEPIPCNKILLQTDICSSAYANKCNNVVNDVLDIFDSSSEKDKIDFENIKKDIMDTKVEIAKNKSDKEWSAFLKWRDTQNVPIVPSPSNNSCESERHEYSLKEIAAQEATLDCQLPRS